MMQIHFVGGFLGSGKTTAIVQAAKVLMADGRKVGVITNDQGKYLVDTAFIHLSDLPAVEVSGGCFCCNYQDLNDQLGSLIRAANPDVIFAESVGSCADIVATVIKPLLVLGDEHIKPSSFSVFVDSRLYLHHLMGEPLPFSEDVVYIFEKQIEEAGLLVLNKVDLLNEVQVSQLETKLEAQPVEMPLRFQNSLIEADIRRWLAQIEGPVGYTPGDSLDLDYDRYGRGEAQMAWLDERLILFIEAGSPQRPGIVRDVMIDFFQRLLDRLGQDHVGIGHLKFILESGSTSIKISFTGISDENWQAAIPAMPPGEVHLLVNARVQSNAQSLRQAVMDVLDQCQSEHRFSFREEDVSFFHPGKPQPTHRMP